ncbi:MAG: cation-translocating P-type ATPase [Clostridia bacterium]|nr:cation-translocating P-type ATPase [Clostridia bacterium]
MNSIYNNTVDEVLERFNTNVQGLSEDEAERRRLEHGPNQLKDAGKKSILRVFLEQFTDFLVIILLAAAVISMFLGDIKSTVVIISVTILNAVLGTVQHIKAEKSLESLRNLASPAARVLRDGNKIEIKSQELVAGDILLLEAGDYVSADGRIIENFSLKTNESSLTGESVSVEKTSETINEENVAIGDRRNMVFTGSLVTYGRAVAVVTSIGMDTELGKIASLLASAKEKKTPLQVSLDSFGKKLAGAIILLCIVIFALNVIRGYGMVQSFMFAVALAVAAIPEALSSIVTIVLAIGTQKMARENAIVRKLQAVESLGSVSVICSDKTGTLTQNKMVAEKVYFDSRLVHKTEMDMNNPLQRRMIEMSILCNDAVTTDAHIMGDPTEIALVDLAEHYKVDELELRKAYPRFCEIPFDSDRKMMSTMNDFGGEFVMITKGAVDVIAGRLTRIASSQGIRAINTEDLKNIEDTNRMLSKQGLRVLAFAYKTFEQAKEIGLEDENGLIFLGLIAMIDPPREESKKAVEDCINAGIKPVMITGDHKITASAIARQIGILKDDSEAIEGNEIEGLSDEELKSLVGRISVYARVSPEHKIRIVKAWQELGNVVAMTGDGVNDAPALKQADIGVAMGKVGTEVAKDAAAMVLTDDNFATIVKAISNGRSIYTNIKNAIRFLLSGNTAGILTVLYTSFMQLPLPFSAVHLLFINLLTDSMPAISLGLEPHREDVMREKPRDISRPLLTKSFILHVLFEGGVIAASTVAAFYYGMSRGGEKLASTMAFAVLALARLLHGFNCRCDFSVFKIGLFTNKYLWYSLITGIALLAAVLSVPPLQEIFDISGAVVGQLGAVAGLACLPLVLIQVFKAVYSSDYID